MDCFSFIRLVNFIRSQNPSPDAVMKMTSDAAWSDDAYMKPVIQFLGSFVFFIEVFLPPEG